MQRAPVEPENPRLSFRPQRYGHAHGVDLLRQSLELRLLLLDVSTYRAQFLTYFERVLHSSSLLKDREVLLLLGSQIAKTGGLVDVLSCDVLRLHSLTFDSQF